MKSIKVDKGVCIGCGNCEYAAEKYFKMDDEGKSKVIGKFNEKDKEQIEEAIRNCPVGAIKLEDEEAKEDK